MVEVPYISKIPCSLLQGASILDMFYPLVINKKLGEDLDDAYHRLARCP
jgi:hypothetical protein